MILANKLKSMNQKPKVEVYNFDGRYSETDTSSYSFTGMDLGFESPTRKVIVGIAARSASSASIVNITLGQLTGVFKGSRINTGGGYYSATLFYLFEIPTGQFATLNISWNRTMLRCIVGAWSVDNLNSTPIDSASAAAVSTHILDANTVADGFVTALSYDNHSSPNSVSDGLTQTYPGGGYAIFAEHSPTIDETNRVMRLWVNEAVYSAGYLISWAAE